jgi:proline dehydrogenase
VLRQALLMLSRSRRLRAAVTVLPVSSSIVRRYVAGDHVHDAVRVTGELVEKDLRVSLDHLGEDTHDIGQAKAVVNAYVTLLGRLAAADLTSHAEVSVKLSAVGQALPGDGEQIARDNAALICAAAEDAGTTVTLDMEDHTTTDSTLSILRDLRGDFPNTGAVLQAYLRRTEADCRDLAYAGSRVRLCKGAYNEPESVAFANRREVDRSFVRCLRVLMAGAGYPMVATHDPRLIDIAGALAVRHGRPLRSYEFQFLFGIRPDEQRRLAADGETVRIYVPYGEDWYGYLMRRLAERPANVAFFLRSLVSRG